MQLVTSCIPVPAAPTTPIGPRRTALAKPSGLPLMIAVPQSGPISRRPRASASRLSATSSSIATLSEKIITCMPSASALRASRAACSPGQGDQHQVGLGVRLDRRAESRRQHLVRDVPPLRAQQLVHGHLDRLSPRLRRPSPR